VPPLEAWERVYVDESFLETFHGNIDCNWCHEGDAEAYNDKTTAHGGIVAFPSEEAELYCEACHTEEAQHNHVSIHTTQDGYYERFTLRSGIDLHDGDHDHVLEEFEAECGKCHASCGQCHVSRPITVGSGLNWKHEFKKTPDMKTNCTACHGSRVGEEYGGDHDGLKADVHYIPKLFKCEDCHQAQEMHGGDGTQLTYRYDENNVTMPRCETCHSYARQSNGYHQMHWEGLAGVTVSCQVCHSQPYKNCNGCHVAGGGITGSSYLSFEIGRNYMKDNERYMDYDYITVRHIPIGPDTFAPWGITDLAYFETSEPTWKLATPHNIQRWTPQTEVAEGETCGTRCHDSDYYLRTEDIDFYETANYKADTGESGYGFDDIEREREANESVIIPY